MQPVGKRWFAIFKLLKAINFRSIRKNAGFS
jgi:hypothetical protein